MGIPYKVVKQKFGFDETGTEKYVVKAVPGEKVSFDLVRKQVAEICGVHRGISNVVIDGVIDVVMNNLQMGHSVELGDLGILRPAIRAKAQDSKEFATAESVYRKKINFIPGKRLKDFMNNVSLSRINIPKVDYTKEPQNEG